MSSPRLSPAPIRGSYRFGDTPYTKEAAVATARRIASHVAADPHGRSAAWWAAAIGLTDADKDQVLREYAELPD